MTQLITGAPIWVWPLLAVLLFVGMRARHERTVPVGLIYGLPLLGVMAVRSVLAVPAAGVIWLVFAVAYVLGAWGGICSSGLGCWGVRGAKCALPERT